MSEIKLPVLSTVAEAWKSTKGYKRHFWLALILFQCAVIAILTAKNWLTAFSGNFIKSSFDFITWPANVPLPMLIVILIFIFAACLVAVYAGYGLIYITLRHQAPLPVRARQAFYVFKNRYFWRLLLNSITKIFLLHLVPMGFLFLLIQMVNLISLADLGIKENLIHSFRLVVVALCIFVFIRLWFSSEYILDRGYSVPAAIKASLHATGRNFWRVFVLWLLMVIIPILLVLPFIVVLAISVVSFTYHQTATLISILIPAVIFIWFLPFAINVKIKVYKALAGGIQMGEISKT